MKRQVLSLALALCLLLGLAVPAAADGAAGALATVQAMGLMTGDENGDLRLEQPVTRAEFAALLSRASAYRDTVGEGSGYSLFTDVKSGHWASAYVKLAVEQGWMVGYTDGSFRPGSTITLEEACTAVLRLLGYDTSALAGTFPTAQLTKAAALGLRDQIILGQGSRMTRQDCVWLFYNALTAQTSGGRIYGETLGYTVTNGQVDYSAIVADNLSGPYVYESGFQLPFTPAAVYRDGSLSSLSAAAMYDVYYYHPGMKTVWICSDRASGTISALSPSALSPTAVTVAGVTYTLGTPQAAYRLSTLGGTDVGDTVTLLLGLDGSVVDVVTGAAVDAVYCGVALSSSRIADGHDGAAVYTQVEVACTDGTVRTFSVKGSTEYAEGKLVSVSVTAEGTSVRGLSEKSLSGKVSGGALGGYKLAGDVRILDTANGGGYVSVTAERLAGAVLGSSHVRYYALNSQGEISDLILSDATGDTWEYGYLTEVDDHSTETNISVTYTYLLDGQTVTSPASSAKYAAEVGGVALRRSGGKLTAMRSLASVTLTQLGSLTASAGNQTYSLAEDIQVYLCQRGGCYATTLSAVNAGDYRLTGWYDSFGSPAGGRIRVITAVPKD